MTSSLSTILAVQAVAMVSKVYLAGSALSQLSILEPSSIYLII